MNNNSEKDKRTDELSEDVKAWREIIEAHADMPEVKKVAELLDQPEAAKKAFLEFAKTNLAAAFCYHYLFKNEPWFEEALWTMVFQNPKTAIRCADEIEDKELRERVIAKAKDISTPKEGKWREIAAEARRRIEQGITPLDEFLAEEKRRKEQGNTE